MSLRVLSLVFGLALAASPALGEGAQRGCSQAPHFDCLIPDGWSSHSQPDYSTKHSKVFGVQLVGPRTPSGAVVSLEASYYSPGNAVHKTAERFIKRLARLDGRAVGLPGEKAGPVESVKFQGLAASRFTRTTFDFIRVTKTSDKKVTVQEEYLVIPAATGYYVLEYRAPPNQFRENREVFEGFKKTFTMLVK